MREMTWRVSGMHCPGCEAAIHRALRPLEGIEDVRADYRAGTLHARWDEARLDAAVIGERVTEAGYTLVSPEPPKHRVLRALLLITGLAALFLLIALSPLGGVLSRFPTAKAGMGLGAIFAVGLMTSLHCVAMCGGINLAQSAASAQAKRRMSIDNLQYNLGRLTSYTAVGGIVGAVGSAFQISAAAQAAIQFVAAAFMILMALGLLGVSASPRLALPGGLRKRLFGHGSHSSLYIGLLNGLMPCGPLQAMQLYALSTGSWRMGALSMFAFGLGTVPLMLGFGLVGGGLNWRFARPMRLASGALVLVMGLSMLTNGLSLAGVPLALPGRGGSDAAVGGADVQLVTSELDWRGYPDITVQAGTPVRWNIHAEAEKLNGCNNEIVIPALDLRVPLQPGDNVVEFTADDPGVIPYTCWMGMLRGSITVEEQTGIS